MDKIEACNNFLDALVPRIKHSNNVVRNVVIDDCVKMYYDEELCNDIF